MGEPKLEWSTIQLRMENQQKIIPLGRRPKVMVDIAGVRVLADFEVIEIVEDAEPYLALLKLDWAMDMGGFINLNKCSMVLENKGTRVIVPLDPTEGARYTEPVYEEEEIDHINKLTVRDEDQVNPMDEGVLCWKKDSEFFSDSDEELENWQGWLHEVSALRRIRTTKNFRHISTKERDLPFHDEAGDSTKIIEPKSPTERKQGALPLTLRGEPAQGPVFFTQEKYWNRVILRLGIPVAEWAPRSVNIRKYLLTYNTQGSDQTLPRQAHLATASLIVHLITDPPEPTCN